jgi:hypothetical protein
MAKGIIELDEDVLLILRAEAESKEMTLAAYLKQLAESLVPINPTSPRFERRMDADHGACIRKRSRPKVGCNREEIYFDHD